MMVFKGEHQRRRKRSCYCVVLKDWRTNHTDIKRKYCKPWAVSCEAKMQSLQFKLLFIRVKDRFRPTGERKAVKKRRRANSLLLGC